MSYVEHGGTVIVQYNTTSEWELSSISTLVPTRLTIGRGRVTDESAKMAGSDPEPPSAEDTQPASGPATSSGWVQERGLYFAHEPGTSVTSPCSA